MVLDSLWLLLGLLGLLLGVLLVMMLMVLRTLRWLRVRLPVGSLDKYSLFSECSWVHVRCLFFVVLRAMDLCGVRLRLGTLGTAEDDVDVDEDGEAEVGKV